jgi:hypothetical protein
MEQMLPSSLRRRPSSPVNIDASERGARDRQRLATLAKQLGKPCGRQSFRMALLF